MSSSSMMKYNGSSSVNAQKRSRTETCAIRGPEEQMMRGNEILSGCNVLGKASSIATEWLRCSSDQRTYVSNNAIVGSICGGNSKNSVENVSKKRKSSNVENVSKKRKSSKDKVESPTKTQGNITKSRKLVDDKKLNQVSLAGSVARTSTTALPETEFPIKTVGIVVAKDEEVSVEFDNDLSTISNRSSTSSSYGTNMQHPIVTPYKEHPKIVLNCFSRTRVQSRSVCNFSGPAVGGVCVGDNRNDSDSSSDDRIDQYRGHTPSPICSWLYRHHQFRMKVLCRFQSTPMATKTLSFGDSATFQIQFDDSVDTCQEGWNVDDTDNIQEGEQDLLFQDQQEFNLPTNAQHDFEYDYDNHSLDQEIEFPNLENGIPLTSQRSIDRLTDELDDDAIMILYRSFGPSG